MAAAVQGHVETICIFVKEAGCKKTILKSVSIYIYIYKPIL